MLIVLEGLDGAGKSTQINLLQKYFEDRGVVVKYLHFPRFDSPVYGDLIARFLRGDLGSIDQVHPYLIALLFAGDRKDAGDMIREWLKE
ncbi:MAG: thymidylate kinase, partial [Bacteroidales bacterium]|nr:thymidylate kinase [Bacteroidales bacterium]